MPRHEAPVNSSTAHSFWKMRAPNRVSANLTPTLRVEEVCQSIFSGVVLMMVRGLKEGERVDVVAGNGCKRGRSRLEALARLYDPGGRDGHERRWAREGVGGAGKEYEALDGYVRRKSKLSGLTAAKVERRAHQQSIPISTRMLEIASGPCQSISAYNDLKLFQPKVYHKVVHFVSAILNLYSVFSLFQREKKHTMVGPLAFPRGKCGTTASFGVQHITSELPGGEY